MTTMKYSFNDIHNDYMILRRMLQKNGWTHGTQVFFMNHVGAPLQTQYIEEYPDTIIIATNHGEPWDIAYDGIWEPHERTHAYWSSNPGNTKLQKRFGHDYPVYTIGWHLTPISPFLANNDPKVVVFAPIHPLPGNGWLHPTHRAANVRAYHALLDIADDFDIFVRPIGTMEDNGLWYDHRVRVLPQSSRDIYAIENADVVVSYNRTFLAKAVAMGVPAVAYAQDYVWFDSYNDDDMKPAETWGTYKNYIRFPHDLFASNDVPETLMKASFYEPTNWKRRFIGKEISQQSLDATILKTFLQG
jgi:hypothetical protein